MMHMKVAWFGSSVGDKEAVLSLSPKCEYSFFDETLTQETVSLAADCDIVCVFVNGDVRKPVIDALPNLKCITTRSTGFDHIDVAYAKERNIAVATVPSYGSRTVAEFAFGLILTLSRKIFKARLRLLEGARFEIEDLRGIDLFGKTLGVVGTGKIGKNVVLLGRAFGMNVLAVDPYPDEAFAKTSQCRYVPLPELLSEADVVTLHAPATKETHHLINNNNILRMKKGAFLINTSRGELIETDAMVRALTSGHLGGVGLDVLEDERSLREEDESFSHSQEKIKDYKTLYEDHLLMDHPNAIVTPHIAFDTDGAVREIFETTIQNIESFAVGKPQNTV